jgi:hypothetical protein
MVFAETECGSREMCVPRTETSVPGFPHGEENFGCNLLILVEELLSLSKLPGAREHRMIETKTDDADELGGA